MATVTHAELDARELEEGRHLMALQERLADARVKMAGAREEIQAVEKEILAIARSKMGM